MPRSKQESLFRLPTPDPIKSKNQIDGIMLSNPLEKGDCKMKNVKKFFAALIAAFVLLGAGQVFAAGNISDVQAIHETSEAALAAQGILVQFYMEHPLLLDDGTGGVGDKIVITYPVGTVIPVGVAAGLGVQVPATAIEVNGVDLNTVATSSAVATANVLEIYLGDGGVFGAAGASFNPGEVTVELATAVGVTTGTAGTGLTVTVATQDNAGNVIDAAGTSQTFNLVATANALASAAAPTFVRTGGAVGGGLIPLLGGNYTVGFTTTGAVAVNDSIIVTFPAGTDLSGLVIGDVTATGGTLAVDALTATGNRVAFHVSVGNAGGQAFTLPFINDNVINPARARNWNFAFIEISGSISEIGYANPLVPLIYGDPIDWTLNKLLPCAS